MAMVQNRNRVEGIRCFIVEVFGLTDAAGVVLIICISIKVIPNKVAKSIVEWIYV